jgi:hypothetical protein
LVDGLLGPAARRSQFEKQDVECIVTSEMPPVHPRLLAGPAPIGGAELRTIHRATSLVEELGADLDRRLAIELRATERLRLLRETTNRITRAANDAIDAYRAGDRAVTRHLAREEPNRATEALATRARLSAAKVELLRALEVAAQRYPWAPELGRRHKSRLPTRR